MNEEVDAAELREVAAPIAAMLAGTWQARNPKADVTPREASRIGTNAVLIATSVLVAVHAATSDGEPNG